MIIDTNELTKARNLILSSYGKEKVIVISKGDDFNRSILENNKVDVLVFREFNLRRDRLKQRDSGLNHVLCRLAKDNNISIGLDLNELTFRINKSDTEYLGRIIQNIRLCNKYKVKIVLSNISSIDKNSLIGLLESLGMSSSMANYAIENSI